MIIKTTGTRYDPLEAWLTRHHPYDVPEVLALSAQEVSGPYLGWLREAVSE
jgi:periplasmic divalent cation tolerance protein